MVAEDEEQALSEAPPVSDGTDKADLHRSDDTGRRPGKRAPKKARAEEPASRKIKRHTATERADKLRRIEEALARDGVSLKMAVEAVGVSDQTYYQWKRAEKSADTPSSSTATSPSPSVVPPSLSNELADLIKLEEENQRLRQLLGEKLRAENTELRRRLELD